MERSLEAIMADKVGEYLGADIRVAAYSFKVQEARTGFVVSTRGDTPVLTLMEGEYTDVVTRERVDPALGLVYRSGEWRRV